MDNDKFENIKVLGSTEEVTTCDRCGRADLKKTYALDCDGTILYLGSSCIAKKYELKHTDIKKHIKKSISDRKAKMKKEIEEATKDLVKKETESWKKGDFEKVDYYYKKSQKIKSDIEDKYKI